MKRTPPITTPPVNAAEASPAPEPQARPYDPVLSRFTRGAGPIGNGLTVMLGLDYTFPRSYDKARLVIDKAYIRQRVPVSGWLKLIDDMPPEASCVSFSCGAAASMNCLPELVMRAGKRGFQTQIETAGGFLTPAFAKKLKNAGLDLVTVNLEQGAGREGKKRWSTAIAGIKNCVLANLPCAAYVMATKENIRDGGLKRTIRQAKAIGADYVWILPPEPAASMKELADQAFGKTELSRLKKIVQKGFCFLEFEVCVAADRKLAYVFPNGDVTPCQCVPFTFGNVRKTPFREILEKMHAHPMCGLGVRGGCLMHDGKFRKEYLSRIDLARYFPVPC